jgi:hypothetical protein
MDEEIKTQANDELAQALASVSDDAVADLASPRMATVTTTDDDFSDFTQSNEVAYDQDTANARNNNDARAFSQAQSRAVYEDPIPQKKPDPIVQSSGIKATNPTSLEDIKDRALSELRPLMESIDIPPQEKYETYLMMLRASDDQSLIEPTFKAARMIEDDKQRAKALLDVIHEINYLNSKTA